MAGFNLPPGCSVADIECAMGADGTCDMCMNPADWCTCDECPVCGSAGDPRCYAEHGLVQTLDQRAGRQGRVTLMFIEDLQLEQYYETLGDEMDEEWNGERAS